MTTAQNDQSGVDSAAQKPDQRPCEISFEQLSGGQKEVLIEHDGKLYRLRLTRKGGLILN